ncbi:protein of unknown function [Caminicella sporogenes DSM 14501]|uniref:Transcobalamin-like C-terminal domain-containing protein n=1 Tax=Caminicella sporogenes DSM 14501 TaxID=1121266 RepID=A0A1M6PDX0_9FIRM|nr:DUF4430 domain-containing protein [Caminicella sporogenes]RKD21436.1 hypothetical protein BET04_08335 [Caminicella sporogenes]SHK06117.1 protein of unknown function [Caminicella sporogenes DSM 14501]
MKKFLRIGILSFILVFVLSISVFADSATVTYRIMSTSDHGGIIFDEEVNTDTSKTYFDVLKDICDNDSSLLLKYVGSGASTYVQGIGKGSSEKDIQMEKRYLPNEKYYSGWMYRVNNELPNYSAGDTNKAKVSDGDVITWYYCCPAYTYFPKLESNDITQDDEELVVNVKAEKFKDVWTWQMETVDLNEGKVVLEYDGESIEADIVNGQAIFDDVSNYRGKTVNIYVKEQYYEENEDPDHCLKIVKSQEVKFNIN